VEYEGFGVQIRLLYKAFVAHGNRMTRRDRLFAENEHVRINARLAENSMRREVDQFFDGCLFQQ
jgi:hypothetical protein